MEDLFGINAHRKAVANNIQKALGAGYEINDPENPENEMQKARVGVYSDTAENRRLNRVGQTYGHKKQEEMPKGKVSTKKEDEPSDKKGASEKQDMSGHAAKASDGALKRAAADEKAPEDVRNAAKEELKKRDDSEIEKLKNKLFNEGDNVYNEVMSKLTDEKDRLSGKIAVDDKYGKYDSKEYLRMLYEFKNAPNSRLKSIISENGKSDEPFNVADKKAAIEILEKRNTGDKMFQPKKKEDKQSSKNESSKTQNNSDKLTRVEKSEITEKVNKFIRKHGDVGAVALERTHEGKQLISELKKYGSEQVGKLMKRKFETTSSEGRSNWFYDLGEMVMGKDAWEKLFTLERHDEYSKTFENEIKLEWDEPETKKEKEILNKTVNSFKEFLEKNPKIELDEDEILAIIDGSATEEEEFEHLTKLKGFNELNEQIEKYVDREE